MLSVILSAYNEEKNIGNTVSTVLAAHEKVGNSFPMEIVIVNDGSVDGTKQVAEELALKNPVVKVLNFEKNQGVGIGFLAGVKAASFEKVTVFPGDNSLTVDYISDIFRYVPKTENLFTYIENQHDRGGFRKFTSNIHHNIYALTFSIPIKYIHGTPVYQKRVIESITVGSLRYSFFSELAVKALRSGIQYAEIPGRISSKKGKSSALKWKVLREVILTYLRLVYEIHLGSRSYFANKPVRVEIPI